MDVLPVDLSSHVVSQCVSVCVCYSVPRSVCWQSVQTVNVLGTSLQPYSAWQALRTLRYISSWQFLRKLVPSLPILSLPPFLLPSFLPVVGQFHIQLPAAITWVPSGLGEALSLPPGSLLSPPPPPAHPPLPPQPPAPKSSANSAGYQQEGNGRTTGTLQGD